MRYLLFVVLAYLAWRWYVAQRPKDTPAVPPSPPQPTVGAAEKMVRCAHCGIHLPQSEALAGVGALHFCSDAHRLQYESQRSS